MAQTAFNPAHTLWPTVQFLRRGLPHIVPFFRARWPLLGLCVFYFYLAFHALSGNQGVMRWVDYEADIVRSTAVLDELKTRRAAMEDTAKRLRGEGLDLDTLDIKARESLFVSRPNEMTIWLDPSAESRP